MVTLCSSPFSSTDEPVLLVEGDERRVLPLDAEAERAVAVGARALAERLEERLADPTAAPARHDRDRELRRLLVDEAVARRVAPEEPVPRRADREPVVDRDEHRVARPPPALDVARRRAPGPSPGFRSRQ